MRIHGFGAGWLGLVGALAACTLLVAAACSSDSSGGAAGSGGSGPAPSAACQAYCQKAGELPRSTSAEVQECLDECGLITSSIPQCASAWNTALSCVVSEGAMVCDPASDIVVAGCTDERSAASDCMEGAGQSACKAYCQKYLALPCAPDMTQEACESQCVQVMSLLCETEALIAYQCAGTRGTMTCDSAGELQTTGCEAEVAALQECVQPPDGGVVGDSCTDGVKNGAEADTDCGGACPLCGPGKECQADGDCASGACSLPTWSQPDAGAPDVGTPCGSPEDCGGTLLCLVDGVGSYCSVACSAASSECPEGTTCNTNLGACLAQRHCS